MREGSLQRRMRCARECLTLATWPFSPLSFAEKKEDRHESLLRRSPHARQALDKYLREEDMSELVRLSKLRLDGV